MRCLSLLYLKIIFRSFGLFFDSVCSSLALHLAVLISNKRRGKCREKNSKPVMKQTHRRFAILKEPQKESNNSNNNKKDGLIKICVNFINKSWSEHNILIERLIRVICKSVCWLTQWDRHILTRFLAFFHSLCSVAVCAFYIKRYETESEKNCEHTTNKSINNNFRWWETWIKRT